MGSTPTCAPLASLVHTGGRAAPTQALSLRTRSPLSQSGSAQEGRGCCWAGPSAPTWSPADGAQTAARTFGTRGALLDDRWSNGRGRGTRGSHWGSVSGCQWGRGGAGRFGENLRGSVRGFFCPLLQSGQPGFCVRSCLSADLLTGGQADPQKVREPLLDHFDQ